VLALRDRPLERSVLERVVLDVDGEPLLRRIEARPLRHRPALEDAVELESEVVVEPARGVLLHAEEEPVRTPLRDRALGLGGAAQVALLPVDVEGHYRSDTPGRERLPVSGPHATRREIAPPRASVIARSRAEASVALADTRRIVARLALLGRLNDTV